MVILAVFILPIVAGLLAFALKRDRVRRILLVSIACVHLLLTISAWIYRPMPVWHNWLAMDDLGIIFLSITSILFFAASLYCLYYLRREKGSQVNEWEEELFFTNAPEAIFTGCLLIFLGAMSFVFLSQHFGMLWVSIEATTLISAPLIYYHRHPKSLEATWKYLLICSVGIALALFGNLLLAVSVGKGANSFLVGDLSRLGTQLNVPWLKAAFIFLFVGYGTKMGLAPFHTWLPDAHSEAPSVISALFSGALLNCAFVGILRAYQVCIGANLTHFCQGIFVVFGIISVFFAMLFIFKQNDYKRMLAYSSVENMGILSLGIGLGGSAVWGATLHVINHSLTKAALFLVAGNILSNYKTKSVKDVQGLFHVLPRSGILWIVGFLFITGIPPSGIFVSKFVIIKTIFESRQYVLAGVFLVLLAVIFISMLQIFIPMAQGTPPEKLVLLKLKKTELFFSIFPPLMLLALVLVLGFYIPPFLGVALHGVQMMFGR